METISLNKGVNALKGATKVAGPVAVASYGYSVYEDIKKYDGADAAKAVGVTTAATAVTVGAGMLATGVGAPVGVAILVAVGVGIFADMVSDSVKKNLIDKK